MIVRGAANQKGRDNYPHLSSTGMRRPVPKVGTMAEAFFVNSAKKSPSIDRRKAIRGGAKV